MRAVQYKGPGWVEVVDVPAPEPGEGQVVVRVDGCATCPNWDVTLWRGVDIFDRPGYPRYPLLPGRPGHEMVGTVSAVGMGVQGIAEGDRVAAIFDSGQDKPGFYSEYAIAQQEQLLRIPSDLEAEEVASLELAQCVAVSFQRAGDLNGLRVGISGLGPAGLIAAQMARALGAAEVVAFEIDAGRRAMAGDLDIDRTVDPTTEEFQELAALPPGDQLDLSIDCVGLSVSTQNLMSVTRSRVLIFGVPHGQIRIGVPEWSKGLQVEGYGKHNRAAGELALALIAQGKLRLAPLITARLPFSRYSEGVGMLQRREALKILYVPDEPEGRA
ncbi:MAG: zinc-binding dehydrogenase [Chloroflexota bacterium]|nr:zinc-binding dehydrogenase [Chloroflexota bacterium]